MQFLLYSYVISDYFESEKDYFSKEFAEDTWARDKGKEDKLDHMIGHFYFDKREAAQDASRYEWYYILEYKASTEDLEYLINHNNDEKSLVLNKVYPLVFKNEKVKEKENP